ncbi:chymotrypsin-2-like [Ischnura elegans]|uniref:chymotrypsin-2-like n=1 Tax=Ischnura elegans TaxID=197161 RepID=UPI001ED88246|nr:chymotrypsin-2-like [Ischnura elegans]
MNTFLEVVVLIICAQVQAFDVRRLRPIGRQSVAVSAKRIMRLRALEDGYESVQPKISGGFSAELGQIPFQVSIHSDANEFCGGVIIHPSYVLTSALCATGGSTFTIHAGVTNLHGDESSRVIVQSTEPIIHDGYTNDYLVNDIALLKLSEQLQFNENISQALLPANNDTYANDPAWISGWGSSYKEGPYSEILQYAPMTVISNDECIKTWGESYVTDGRICARGDSGEGGCTGDEGGPLFKDLSGGGPNLLIGITSFHSSKGCGIAPDGYTRVSYYRDWILSNVK